MNFVNGFLILEMSEKIVSRYNNKKYFFHKCNNLKIIANGSVRISAPCNRTGKIPSTLAALKDLNKPIVHSALVSYCLLSLTNPVPLPVPNVTPASCGLLNSKNRL